jgi:hypothetical protein
LILKTGLVFKKQSVHFLSFAIGLMGIIMEQYRFTSESSFFDGLSERKISMLELHYGYFFPRYSIWKKGLVANAQVFIETGTCFGNTSKWAATHYEEVLLDYVLLKSIPLWDLYGKKQKSHIRDFCVSLLKKTGTFDIVREKIKNKRLRQEK